MITVAVHEPLAIGTAQIATLTSAILDYTHESHALGGYWSARIRIDAQAINVDDWYERGLGRRIVTYSPEGIVVWEGFVNTVRLNLGRRSKTIGPVMDIANVVVALYSDVTTSIQAETVAVNDTTSQNRYSVLKRVLSAGLVSSTMAAQYADTHLAEQAQPDTSEETSDEPASLVLDCLGYVHMLKRQYYTNISTGTQNLSVKLAAVLNADPNTTPVFSSANAQIEANTIQVQVNDDNNRTSWNVIKSLVALGTSAEARCLFGVYAGRMVQYRSVVQQVDYLQSIRDTSQQVQTAGGASVAPWYVLPGKWVKATDFLVGRVADTADLRNDPRFTFIEAVKYTAPYSLTLHGGKTDRIDQMMGRMGLRGI